MAVRIIEYSLSPSGLTPADIQFGGIAGDHNATRLDFILNDTLLSELSAREESIVYHFESYDALGERKMGDVQSLDGGTVCFCLENWLTRHGGTVCVYLVISAAKDDTTLMRLYSFPAYLRLEERSGSVTDGSEYEAVPTMAAMVKKRCEQVLAASDAVAAAAAQTLSAAVSLSEGSQFIFSAGGAAEQVSVELAVDDALSGVSHNPVQNSVVTAELEAVKNSKQDKIDIAELKAQIVSACHPVGSYYWSESATEPANLFGGVWERVLDRFVLACGDTFSEGLSGGRQSLRLSAAIGATQNDIYSLGYATAAASAYQSGHSPSYVLSGDEVGQSHKYWNHSVPVTDMESSEWDTEIMPPFVTAYCWKRIG